MLYSMLDSDRRDNIIYDRCMDNIIYYPNFSRDNKIGSKEISGSSLPNLIYRFKFTENFMKEKYNFSKIHEYEKRKDLKEA